METVDVQVYDRFCSYSGSLNMKTPWGCAQCLRHSACGPVPDDREAAGEAEHLPQEALKPLRVNIPFGSNKSVQE